MKTNILFIIIAIFMIGCGEPTHTDHYPAPIVTGDEPPVVVDPSGDASEISPLFALKVDDTLYFSNHTEMSPWKTGNIDKSGPLEFSHENELYSLDASGDTLSIAELAETPTHIKTTDAGVFMCVEYSAELAYSLGGQARIYSEIYQDDVIVSVWYDNPWECKDIISSGSEVFAINQHGAHEQLNGVYGDIELVHDDFIMHTFDSVNSRMNFNSQVEAFTMNHILAADNWQLYDGLYYSENGYTWSSTEGLSEEATALWDFNEYPFPVSLPFGEYPVMLTAGIYNDNLYWIECNSGWVFRYNPALDTLTQEYRIYYGDGMHMTGELMSVVLTPVMVDEKLYFNNDNSVYSLNLNSGLINIFYGSYAEILRYD